MIQFPKEATPSERYIMLMFIENGQNKKAAAHFSGVGVRRAQIVVKKYNGFLSSFANITSH